MPMSTSSHDPFWDPEDSADDEHAFEMQAAIVKIAQATSLTMSKSFRSSCSYSKCRSKDEQTDHEDIGGKSDLRNSWAQTRESPTGSTPGSDTNSTARQSRLGYEPARQDRKSKIYDLESLVHRANINRSSYRIHRQQVASSIVDSWQRENAHCPESSKKGATMTRQKQAGRPHAAVAVAY